jgi:S1-C subfamily serine protease
LLLAAAVAGGVSYAMVNLQRRDTSTTVVRGTLAQPGQASGPQTAAQRATDSVVRIAAGPGGPVGSGSIVDSRGYVLTAETLVAGAAGLTVAIPSGKTMPALVVGTDPAEGLALLKVEAGSLKPLQLFGGTPLETGSGVAVMGAPPGFQMAVGAVATAHTTAAIADPAQPGRQVVLNDLVALDVAQRDGQLGAPILDGAGRLIGVVVAAGGAAEQAGIAAGDIVVSADGTSLDPTHPLIRILRGLSVRQSVALTLKTPSTTKSVSLPLALAGS